MEDQISALSEMTHEERWFLHAALLQHRPKKILEAGVSAGGSSAVILNAIQDQEDAVLHSVDICKAWYKNPQQTTGFLGQSLFPAMQDRWHLHLGQDISFVMEDIGQDIDFVVLDTLHTHPVESLNFLAMLPFLRDGCTVILHDIFHHILDPRPQGLNNACAILFSAVVADKELPEANSTHWPNIGKFTVTPQTRAHVQNIFISLSLCWGVDVQDDILEQSAFLFEKYYTAQSCALFKKIRGYRKAFRAVRENIIVHPPTLADGRQVIARLPQELLP